jgi:lantibiotic modifying enzyme
MTTTMTAALDTALAVASRLADADLVRETACREDNRTTFPDGSAGNTWVAATLSNGHAGTALALAEFAGDSPSYADAAREHLRAAVRAAGDIGARGGLYSGFTGIGYAATAIAESPGECARLIASCTRETVGAAETFAGMVAERDENLAFHHYDLCAGLVGHCRYLLRTQGAHSADTVAAVDGLVQLVGQHDHPGPLPPWTVLGNPGIVDGPEGQGERRLLDLGMAHGLAGVLACLAIAKRAGVVAAGLDAAIDTAASWLLSWRDGARTGQWPTAVWPWEEESKRSAAADRLAWCYGTPGIAASLYLTGRPELVDLAVTALTRTCRSLAEHDALRDVGICHGWAGIATVLLLMADSDGTGELGEHLDRAVQYIVDRRDDDLPFLFRYDTYSARLGRDDPSFLTGAAGTALTLLAYSRRGATRTGWHELLLLA